jgi:hypothetical protein
MPPRAVLDESGAIRPQGVSYQQDVVNHYHEQLARVCGAVPTCEYDNGELQKYPLVAGDLNPDGNHLTVAGLQKYADLVWKTFFSR